MKKKISHLREQSWTKYILTLAVLIILMACCQQTQVMAAQNMTKVKFGSYPQDQVKDDSILSALSKLKPDENFDVVYKGERYRKRDNGNWYIYKSVEWRILKKEGNKAFVMSECILDNCGISDQWDDKSWANSIAREWLNSKFYNSAFNSQEKKYIYKTDVHTDRGGVTQDWLFYPSVRDLQTEEYGFTDGKSRIAGVTDYSCSLDCYLTRDTSSWFGLGKVCGVYNWNGSIQQPTIDAWWGARPCMYINLAGVSLLGDKDIAKAKITLARTLYTYDGREHTPSVKVVYGKTTLKKNTDYTVAYRKNRYVGKAQAIVTGKGKYTGKVTKYFTIKSPGIVRVTFNPNKGTVSDKTKNVKRGERYGKMPTPTRNGYTFAGWYTSAGSGTRVTENTFVNAIRTQTLYARWKCITYSVTYEYNGGSKVKNPTSYTIETNTRLKYPSKEGYRFAGWYDKKTSKRVTSLSSGLYRDLSLYAKWKANTYNIYFERNGSLSRMEPMSSLEYGRSYNLKRNTFIAPPGMMFKEWNTKPDGTGKSFSDGDSIKNLTTANGHTIKLYAQWQLFRYKITYVLPKNVSNSKENPSSYNIREMVKLSNPGEKTGYLFKGWYDKKTDGNRITHIKKGSTGSRKLYARFDPIEYTIRFDGNGKISDIPKRIKCEYDKEYSVPGTSEIRFMCWNTQKDGHGIDYYPEKSIFSNCTTNDGEIITLYAKCRSIIPEVTEYTKGVQKGKIRRVSQKSNLENNGWIYNGYNYTKVAGMECGAASSSMAVSYLGKDISPGEICYVSGKGAMDFRTQWISWDGVTCDNVSGVEFNRLFNRYNDDDLYKYSPVIIHLTKYPGTSTHYVVVIGKNSDGTYKICDPVDKYSTWDATINGNYIIGIDGRVNCIINQIVQYSVK